MFIDNKYFYVATGESYLETPPKVYVDFFHIGPSYKYIGVSSHMFYFEFGFFGKCITGTIKWGYIENKKITKDVK